MSQMNFSMANISNISKISVHQKPEAFTFSAQTKVMLFSILLVWSLLGNVLVIAIVILNKNLRTNFNCLIVNMAVSDLFIPLLILPLKIVQETNGPDWLVDGPLGEALCKLVYFLTDISPLVSILSLVIITVNRFVSITYPMKIGVLRGKTSWVLLAFTWIAPMALLSPYFYTFRLLKKNGITHCISLWTPAFDDLAARTIFITVVIVVAFLVPLTAILILYSLMLYQLKKSSDKVIHMLNNRQLLFRQRRNKQIFYFCIAIIASFICFLGPFFCFMFVLNFVWRWDFKGKVVKIRTILFVVQFLAHLNPAINPCIYFLFLKDYRKGLRRLLVDSKRKPTSILLRRRKSTKISTLLEYFPLGKVRNKSTSV
ncbi:neuropeptide FF receptor 2-like [Actinia tenebrosa]|uniref:Neuropeptide FF receptor 2-like n=1 Tax=Actinia tenebrosa TaxID=6105 RepID=A0A6P8H2A6_ACTTE|nr:neuropeptide FF receptor 2-like [Actinia tenebrosa]